MTMSLRDIRIGTRLAIGFGAFVVLMVAGSIGGVALMKKGREDLMAVLQAAGTKENLAARMKALVLEQSATMRNIGLHSDIKAMQGEEDRARTLGRAYDEAREAMSQAATSQEEREIIETLGKLDREVERPFQQALGLSTSFQNELAAKVLMNQLDPVVQKALAGLNRLIEIQRKSYEQAIESAARDANRLAMAVYLAATVVVLVAAGLAWLITRSITGPLAEAVSVTRRVASGDLTSRIEASGRDEPAELLRSLREMNEGLARIVAQIRTGAESIAVGAGQVASGNQQLSSRTEEHASSLEETASTLEEFTTTVRQNAEHAKQASQLAGGASTTAEKGGEVVSKVVQTMQDVTASSKRISDIIGVIDGISFQTNILALNAAVEAARAGEQGRGFAVVASEVRSLAQRSAASAKEIRGLIEDSVGRVEAGARLVEQAGKTMDELVASVRKVADIMTEIASASHQQSSGIDQINKAITQMDTVVQMNASLVEQATAAATSMANQATHLSHAVAQFRLEAGASAALRAMPQEPKALAAHAAAGGRTAAAAAPAAGAMATAGDDEDWKEF
jgi:X-X-X-Leu-X-X-Gly heptad repeat protein